MSLIRGQYKTKFVYFSGLPSPSELKGTHVQS